MTDESRPEGPGPPVRGSCLVCEGATILRVGGEWCPRCRAWVEPQYERAQARGGWT